MNEVPERTLKESLIELSRLYAGPFLTGLVVVISIFLVLTPSWISLADARRKLADRTPQAQRLANKVAQLSNMDAGQMQDELEKAVRALPTSLPYEATLSLLSTLIEEDHLGVTGLTMLGETRENETVLAVDVKVVGSYDSINQFLTQLEQATPLATVRTIEITQRNSAGEGQQIQYQSIVDLAVHQSPPPKTIGKASDPLPSLSSPMQHALDVIADFKTFATGQSGGELTPGKSVGRLFQPTL